MDDLFLINVYILNGDLPTRHLRIHYRLIKRLSYDLLQPQEIRVVYISAAELGYRQVNQSYTLLERGNESALFRYQSGNFQESIPVDSNGIVTVYPDLFYREIL
ncbi:putative glycolipid-binding domain-containing protein [Brevibacillus reuszeri]|uniref:putative glycolipid-binding domain-containing protein n=1 Tax=Brevibacillus reuszeri TaxID=54915 RepID=UPI001F35A926|nr:putative glycolipid-binding domain-containing protein [Brevibacillus reuszeri]